MHELDVAAGKLAAVHHPHTSLTNRLTPHCCPQHVTQAPAAAHLAMHAAALRSSNCTPHRSRRAQALPALHAAASLLLRHASRNSCSSEQSLACRAGGQGVVSGYIKQCLQAWQHGMCIARALPLPVRGTHHPAG
jgi:hypothetical protein